VEFLRKLGIDRERQQANPAGAFVRIEGALLEGAKGIGGCWPIGGPKSRKRGG
jgi:hypothetical protein